MIYVVMYLDGTSEVVDRSRFSEVDIDKVERVYPGNYEVSVVSELVPLGEEKEKLTETVATFRDKYNGAVVTTDGMVEFEEWFKNSSTGDSAVIPEKVLVPQKTYKVKKIKGMSQVSSGKGAKKVDMQVDVKKPEKTESDVQEKSKPAKKKVDDDRQASLFNEPEKKAEEKSVKKKTAPVKKVAKKPVTKKQPEKKAPKKAVKKPAKGKK